MPGFRPCLHTALGSASEQLAPGAARSRLWTFEQLRIVLRHEGLSPHPPNDSDALH